MAGLMLKFQTSLGEKKNLFTSIKIRGAAPSLIGRGEINAWHLEEEGGHC